MLVLAGVRHHPLTFPAPPPPLPPLHPPPHPLRLSFFLFSLLIANLQSCTADQAGTSRRLKGADDLEQKTRSLQTGGISLLRNQLLQEAEGAAARGTRQEGRRRTRLTDPCSASGLCSGTDAPSVHTMPPGRHQNSLHFSLLLHVCVFSPSIRTQTLLYYSHRTGQLMTASFKVLS